MFIGGDKISPEVLLLTLFSLVQEVHFTQIKKSNESCLASESVQGASLALERVDDIHGRDGLAAGVLGVRDGIPDDVLEEHLEDSAGLFVDEAGDALHATPASETADRGLGDALDVIPEYLAVPLGASLAESLSSFAASRHFVCLCCVGL